MFGFLKKAANVMHRGQQIIVETLGRFEQVKADLQEGITLCEQQIEQHRAEIERLTAEIQSLSSHSAHAETVIMRIIGFLHHPADAIRQTGSEISADLKALDGKKAE